MFMQHRAESWWIFLRLTVESGSCLRVKLSPFSPSKSCTIFLPPNNSVSEGCSHENTLPCRWIRARPWVIMEPSRSCPQAAPAPNDGWVHLVEKIDQLNRNGGFLLPLWGLLRDSFPRSMKICVFNLRSLTIFLSPTSHEVQFNCSFNFLLLQYPVNLLLPCYPSLFPFYEWKKTAPQFPQSFLKSLSFRLTSDITHELLTILRTASSTSESCQHCLLLEFCVTR